MKKRILTLVMAVLFGGLAFAQSVPQGMKMQAVARALDGQIIANKEVVLVVSLVSFINDGEIYFTETHRAKTNDLGLMDLTIGTGQNMKGTLRDVPWATEEIWVDFRMGVDANSMLVPLGATRLMTVPYAFHAGTAGDIANVNNDIPLPEACPPGAATGSVWSLNTNCGPNVIDARLGPGSFLPLRIVTDNIERVIVQSNGDFNAHEEGLFDKTLTTTGDMFGKSNLTVDLSGTFASERVKIDNNTTGDASGINGYIIQIDNVAQGIGIQLNATLTQDQRFLGFFDQGGALKGSISGISEAEFDDLASTVRQTAVFTLKVIQITANLIALVAEGVGAAGQIFTGSVETVAVVAQTVSWAVELALFILEETDYEAEKEAETAGGNGITVNSGNGDYAEWLERAPGTPDLEYGQIVGVKGGKISLDTRDADHVMVVSMEPIVLGNMPPAGMEAQYEKVAFIGQVPVNVVGPAKIGDFILASGNADGMAIAVPKERMKMEDFDRIVGVAWQNSQDAFFGHINVAVGVNANDMADPLAVQARDLRVAQAKLMSLEAKVLAIEAFLSGKGPAPKFDPQDGQAITDFAVAGSQSGARGGDEELPKYTDEYLESIRPQLELGMRQAEKVLNDRGATVSMLPAEAQVMFLDPVQGLKNLQSGEYGMTTFQEARRVAKERKGK